jgi:hypothetical protein
VTRGPLSFGGRENLGGGGMQVATVKASTSLRTKNRGKVPPKLETLHQTLAQSYGRRGGEG